MSSDSGPILIAIVVLICMSAFFSASETALSTFNKIRMRKKAEDGDKKAKAVLKLWDNYDITLSSILVGNNIVNILCSTLATVFCTAVWGPTTGAVVSTASITILILMFGEVAPKSYGKENADKAVVAVVKPLSFVVVILKPFAAALTKFASSIRGESDQSPSITEEELIYMMDTIEEEGVLEEQERDLVQSALVFDEITVKEILTPRVNIVALDVEGTAEEAHKLIVDEGYSRIPVFEKTIDNIIGVLYSRDLLLSMIAQKHVNLREMLGESLFIHKGMKVSQLLQSFKEKKLNLAVVVDEYGGTLGIVTMEDVLEELVGEIWDEDEEIENVLTKISDTKYEVLGSSSLDEFFEELNIAADTEDTGYSTLGGWALHKLRHIPTLGERFEFNGYTFEVLDMQGHRLKKLLVEQIIEDDSDDGQFE